MCGGSSLLQRYIGNTLELVSSTWIRAQFDRFPAYQHLLAEHHFDLQSWSHVEPRPLRAHCQWRARDVHFAESNIRVGIRGCMAN